MTTGIGCEYSFVSKTLAPYCFFALIFLGFPALASQDGQSAPGTFEQDIRTGVLSSPVSGLGTSAPLDPLTILGVEPASGTVEDQQFLQPDEAFRFSTRVLDQNTVVARWQIADTYYLYRDKFKFALTRSAGVRLGKVSLPIGKTKTDPFFGKVIVFFHATEATIHLIRSTNKNTDLKLEVGYQGCTELGLCYPPITKKISLTLPAATD